MNILLYGASGMVGQGVMRECLSAEDVGSVTVIVRSLLPDEHPKLRQVVSSDLIAPLTAEDQPPSRFDACFFCLGVSSSGMSEEQYNKLTFDLTLSVANKLVQLNPQMAFIYVSGAGTDSSEKGSAMWARVKGKTENALLKLKFAHSWMFRPGIIQPLHGIRSKTASYRVFYQLMTPFFPVLRVFFPHRVLTTVEMGRAMLNAVRKGESQSVLETRDIKKLANMR